jgi:hypothetical protein
VVVAVEDEPVTLVDDGVVAVVEEELVAVSTVAAVVLPCRHIM